MKQVFKTPFEAGSVNASEPRLTAKWNRTTYLCVDLKTILRSDRHVRNGKDFLGVLTHDGPDHYTFVETPSTTDGRRNPHVFVGRYITVTRRGDGTLRANLRQTRVHAANIDSYALGVCDELREALRGLVGEDVE